MRSLTSRRGGRKKPSGGKAVKVQRDDAAKELFEQHGWAKNEVTMEKVISVRPALPSKSF